MTPQFITAAPRFAYDGKARMPNFLNGLDGQLLEARAAMAPVDTATHTHYDFSGTGAGNLAHLSMAAEMARSLNACSAIRAGRPKSATARSLVANDTRYGHLAEPHLEHVGPGAYAMERGSPGLGQLPLDSAVSSAMPARDPYRASSAFLTRERPGSADWVPAPGMCGPDAVYVSPEFVPSPDRAVPWQLTTDKRTDAAEWRLGHARTMAAVAAGGGPGAGPDAPEAPFSSDLPRDVASRPLDLSLRAALKNTTGVSFSTKEPRLTSLPPERTSDVRASRLAALRGPEEAAHLGPGCYTPPTSVGGAKRRTYRLFVDPYVCPQPNDKFGSTQDDAAAVVAARDAGSSRSASSARAASRASPHITGGGDPSAANVPTSGGGQPSSRSATGAGGAGGNLTARSNASASSLSGGGRLSGGVTRLASSPAFTGPFRSQKTGAFDNRTDSRLIRH
ncbi:hypothetical protein GPECTOR_81g192 [Gonium pectorale]|uniref:Uncharacterized protein n=1 Tax=Gonium pectorale TaxID=33097 RepID=A0A150G1P7_GONPE|nr:hypothetical protein GPECTOR_81g192 [Gonium pectorale]|eukprot:KXZ43744.1 hypothetical protein GPECTOR_81g192 [Gonium pectorale]